MICRTTIMAMLALPFVAGGGGSPDTSPDVSPDGCTFNTLLFLVGPKCANIASALPGTTVFGPCDDAFAAFLKETDLTTEELCGPLVDTLIEILTYHVVDKTLTLKDIEKSKNNIIPLKTLQGQKIIVNRNRLTVNGCDIVDPDAVLEPYVLHGIDCVLIPKGGGKGKKGGKKGGYDAYYDFPGGYYYGGGGKKGGKKGGYDAYYDGGYYGGGKKGGKKGGYDAYYDGGYYDGGKKGGKKGGYDAYYASPDYYDGGKKGGKKGGDYYDGGYYDGGKKGGKKGGGGYYDGGYYDGGKKGGKGIVYRKLAVESPEPSV